MCGIIGVINGSDKIKTKLGTIFDDMLWADQIRGTDGAGVLWFDSRGDTYSVLKDEDIDAVRKANSYRQALLWIEKMPFFVGHNRSATRGSVSSENNHPFDEGNVVLVHNGTMTHIPKEYDDGTKVDSHAIAKMLHKASPQEFMTKSFGAFALVWFDKMSRQLNILRNAARPLYLVHFDDFILVSSEAMLAAWCASRNGHGYKSIEEVKEHTLYQYNPFDIKNPIITDLSSLKSFHTQNYSGVCGPHSTYNGYLDDDEVALSYMGYDDGWRRPRQLTHTPNNVSDMQYQRAKRQYDAINPWTYFLGIHGNTESAGRNGVLSFKKGHMINFIMDGGQEHGSFTHFVGKIPNLDIKDYVVRGNVAKTLDEVVETDGQWVGEISDIKTKHGKLTIYVKEAKPVEEIIIPEKQQ